MLRAETLSKINRIKLQKKFVSYESLITFAPASKTKEIEV
jgi:ethanolamine utilization protein EutA (predicted chaperonin)